MHDNDYSEAHYAIIINGTAFVVANVNPNELPPEFVLGVFQDRSSAFEFLTTEVIKRLEAEHEPFDKKGWVREL